jgi:cell division protein FtsN
MNLKQMGTAMLGSMIEPLSNSLNKSSAKQILALKASPAANRRLARLARKSDEGKLTPEERAEYLFYVQVGDFIALLQARARRLLASQAHS